MWHTGTCCILVCTSSRSRQRYGRPSHLGVHCLSVTCVQAPYSEIGWRHNGMLLRRPQMTLMGLTFQAVQPLTVR